MSDEDDDLSASSTLVVQYDEERWQPTQDQLEDLVGAIDGVVPDDVETIALPKAIEFIPKEEARGVLARLLDRALTEN